MALPDGSSKSINRLKGFVRISEPELGVQSARLPR